MNLSAEARTLCMHVGAHAGTQATSVYILLSAVRSDTLSYHSSKAEMQCLTYQHGDLIFSN